MITVRHAATRNALDLISIRLEHSLNPQDFLREVDILLEDDQNLLVLRDAVELDEPLATGDESINARATYEALGAIDKANASDPRIWSYLAFLPFRDYMLERWPLTAVDNWKGRVQTRWLMRKATRQNLVRHGIARLWWVANLTFDAPKAHQLSMEQDDPFAYTNWVFGREDRIQAIFEREAGSTPAVLTAAIDAMASVDTRSHGAFVKRYMKEVTAASAYRDLDLLDREALAEVMRDLLPAEEGTRLVPTDR